MRKLEKVLVAVDFSEASRAAVSCAGALARKLDAATTALYVEPRFVTYEQLPAFPPPVPLDPDRRSALEEDLRRFAAPEPVEPLVLDGDPADEILEGASGSDVDLIVLGTHGHRGFERWSLGSVTDRVARRATRPVLTVPPHVGTPVFARVLCALDLADGSAETLEHAAWFAQALGAQLTVLHVAEGSHWYEPWPIAGVDQEEVRRVVGETVQARITELIAAHVPPTLVVRTSIAFGRAQTEVTRVAAEGTDLVVLGVRSTVGLDHFFFGSTAQHVLRAGICPVLLVRQQATARASS